MVVSVQRSVGNNRIDELNASDSPAGQPTSIDNDQSTARSSVARRASDRRTREIDPRLLAPLTLIAALVVCLAVSVAPASASGACPNEARRQEQASTFLANCRAYELVTPAGSPPIDYRDYFIGLPPLTETLLEHPVQLGRTCQDRGASGL